MIKDTKKFEKMREKAATMKFAFPWGFTPEKWEYWNNINKEFTNWYYDNNSN